MRKYFVLVLVFFFAFASLAAAAERGTADEAQVMVKKAVAFAKKNGKEAALKEINNPKGEFVKKDLYIYVLDLKGTCIAHEANPRLIGKNFMQIKDSHGNPFIKEIIDTSSKKGFGWTDYYWSHPVTKKNEAKSSYFEKVMDMVFICGYYK
ncbi:MAG: cache domain-containing protein [Syntrophales bacterium]|nr:cache domain-containing protein [Syntrophales bacterium]MDD5234426.1 cache domain-containing protein [Syntrophales bacterium]MDD5533259.1 cache domain-containing protein [Syntrophales bacterium]